MPRINKQGESIYAKRQRRRAERIIKSTDDYSATFRNEVQDALDNCPWKLAWLFRDEDEINRERLKLNQAVRASLRALGYPLPRVGKIKAPPQPRKHKNCAIREAEQIETLFIEHENENLDENWQERAELISDILFDIGNESRVNATHPQLVKGYVLAMRNTLPNLERHGYDRVWNAFTQVRDLMNGCSEERFDQIRRSNSSNWEIARQARAEEAGEVYVPRPSIPAEAMRRCTACHGGFIFASDDEQPQAETASQLTSLREKLANLEVLPENEAVAFQLETEIHQLEREASDEWPDLIGGEGGSDGSL